MAHNYGTYSGQIFRTFSLQLETGPTPSSSYLYSFPLKVFQYFPTICQPINISPFLKGPWLKAQSHILGYWKTAIYCCFCRDSNCNRMFAFLLACRLLNLNKNKNWQYCRYFLSILNTSHYIVNVCWLRYLPCPSLSFFPKAVFPGPKTIQTMTTKEKQLR